MPAPISHLSSSSLNAPLGDIPEALAPEGLAVSSHIANGSALRLSGIWLNQQKSGLSQGQLRVLNVALSALEGREAVSNIQQDERGGNFNLARPSYGAFNVHYQREESAPDTLGFLCINDQQTNRC